MEQIKGTLQGSQNQEIVLNKDGEIRALTGDAVYLMTARTCIIGIEMNLKGHKMLLNRGMTISKLCATASKLTGKAYNPRKAEDKMQATKDLRDWIATLVAATPVTVAKE